MEQNQDQPQQPNEGTPMSKHPMAEYFESQQQQEDERWTAVHDGMTIMGEKMADMMGIEDFEERTKLIEGYRSLFPGAQSAPAMMMPVIPPKQPDSTCTVEMDDLSVRPSRRLLVTVDWQCLLGSAWRQTFDIESGTCTLNLYRRNNPVQLNREQTKSMLKYLHVLNEAMAQGGYTQVRIPTGMFAHPSVKKLIEEE